MSRTYTREEFYELVCSKPMTQLGGGHPGGWVNS